MNQKEGKHLLLDSQCLSQEALVNVNIGSTCLIEIVNVIQMTMVLPPVSVKFPRTNSDAAMYLASLEKEGLGHSKTAEQIRQDVESDSHLYNGYSSFVMIAESHLSLHTFPERDFLSFDCYTCKGFEHQHVLEVLERTFRLSSPKVQVMVRSFPRTQAQTQEREGADPSMAGLALNRLSGDC